MTKKIFRSIFFATFVGLIVSFVLTMGALYQYFGGLSERQLRNQLDLAAQGVELEGNFYFEGLDSENYRITWIDSDGTVIYDNEADPDQMGNHANREEFIEAKNTGYGESVRYSDTMTTRLVYEAKELSDGSVLRMSITQYSVFMLVLGLVQPLAVAVGLALAFSAFMAMRLAKRIVRPLNEIDLDHPLENVGYEEISPLLHRIDAQQDELAERSGELGQKQKELDTILENMAEGMILLKRNGKILAINKAASDLLDTDRSAVGRPILTISRNLDLENVIEKAYTGERAEKVITFHGGSYQVSASPVSQRGDVIGVAVIMYDVTEHEQAEQMRREFSGNVSHELKTPLHSISGYAELMKDGLVKPEDVRPFAGKIYKEAQRAIQLVADIISLSHLDEGAEDMKREKVDLYAEANAAVCRLLTEAKNAHVTLTIGGSHAEMIGVPDLLETITYNLCNNAIRYNKPGGMVHVEVRAEDGKAILDVRDNGIGIPKKDQKRIFERFYRVDKSRSRAVGGTGLGLSIVKHAVMIHHGQIDLQSAENAGTHITVTFPTGLNAGEPSESPSDHGAESGMEQDVFGPGMADVPEGRDQDSAGDIDSHKKKPKKENE